MHAGFRVAQLQTPDSTASSTHQSSHSATPDVVYSSWEDVHASSLLQLTPSHSTSSSSSNDSAIVFDKTSINKKKASIDVDIDVQNTSSESKEEKDLPQHVTAEKRPYQRYPRCRLPFPQGVSLSILELHNDDRSSTTSTQHAVVTSSTIESSVAAEGSANVRDTHAHARVSFQNESSVPVTKEAVAAAFMSMDEELDDFDDDLEGFEGFEPVGVHCVPSAAQNVTRTDSRLTVSEAARKIECELESVAAAVAILESVATVDEDLESERNITRAAERKGAAAVEFDTVEEEVQVEGFTAEEGEEAASLASLLATADLEELCLVDDDDFVEVDDSAQEHVSLVDWDDEPEPEPDVRTLLGRTCPCFSLLCLCFAFLCFVWCE